MEKKGQKKTYKRKSIISNGLITLIGIFIFLLVLFILVKTGIIYTNKDVVSEEKVQNGTSSEILEVKNTVNIASYIYNAQNTQDSGYFSKLTGSDDKQVYVSLVLEEDKLLGYNGVVLNKFIITVFDTEVLETFTGTFEWDDKNIVLKFLTNTYNNYTLPEDIKVYIDNTQAILDGNKLTRVDNIAKVYSNDELSSLPSVFGDSNVNFASLLIIKDDLSDFGVALQSKFLITGFNQYMWDYYMGEAYENDSIINLKMKNYGLNTLNDVMPKEASVNINNEGIIIDDIQFKE